MDAVKNFLHSNDKVSGLNFVALPAPSLVLFFYSPSYAADIQHSLPLLLQNSSTEVRFLRHTSHPRRRRAFADLVFLLILPTFPSHLSSSRSVPKLLLQSFRRTSTSTSTSRPPRLSTGRSTCSFSLSFSLLRPVEHLSSTFPLKLDAPPSSPATTTRLECNPSLTSRFLRLVSLVSAYYFPLSLSRPS